MEAKRMADNAGKISYDVIMHVVASLEDLR
jgi:hypothetical protein